MGKSTPQPPPPPDPNVVAAAQTASNVNTAVANSVLGNANQYTPYGSTTFEQTGGMQVGDQFVPQYTQTTTLSPAQQHLLEQQQQLGSSLNDVAIAQTDKIGNLLSTPLQAPSGSIQRNLSMGTAPTTFSGAGQIQKSLGSAGPIATGFGGTAPIQSGFGSAGPVPMGLGQTSGNIQYGFGNAGNIATGFGDAGSIQRSIANLGPGQQGVGPTAQGIQGQVGATQNGVKYDVGPQDWSQDRQRVEEAIYSRLNPQLDRDRDRLGNELVNQGFVRGTEAFNNAMDEANRQATDARMQAILAGGQEQSRLADLSFRQGDFWNRAQGQEYGQNLQSGNFANQAQMQDFQQQLARGQFSNEALQQLYGRLLSSGQFANEAQVQDFMQQFTRGQFGNQAQQQQFGQNLQAGQFANQAQLQEYAQMLSRGQFGQEGQQQLFNQLMASGKFANEAQAQDFMQQMARGQFSNEAQQQLYNELLQSAQFANAAQSQQYDQNLGAGQFAQQGTQINNAASQAAGQFANQAYAQQLQTDLALRNQPINEITALMSGGQVTMPQFQGYQPGNVGMTPIGDYYMQNAQMANQQYLGQLNANAQMTSGLYGGLSNLAGMGLYGLAKSDRRIKTNIKRVGEWINGLPIYLFRFIGGPLLHVGFMAQDVEQLVPAAVVEINGIKHVNYPLAMRS